jgi:hypothetical protein
MSRRLIVVAGTLALAACGGGGQDRNEAQAVEASEKAVEASEEAVEASENKADAVRDAVEPDDEVRPIPPDRAGPGEWNRPRPKPGPKQP